MFVGYTQNHEGYMYQMWNNETDMVHTSRDVVWFKRMFFYCEPVENVVSGIYSGEDMDWIMEPATNTSVIPPTNVNKIQTKMYRHRLQKIILQLCLIINQWLLQRRGQEERWCFLWGIETWKWWWWHRKRCCIKCILMNWKMKIILQSIWWSITK